MDKEYKWSLALYDQGKYVESLSCIDVILKRIQHFTHKAKNEEEIRYLNHKALCLSILGREKEAITMYEKAIENNNMAAQASSGESKASILSRNSEYIKNKAKLLLKLHEHEEALVEINRALEISNKNRESYEIKGFILYELKRDNEAIDYFMKAIDTYEKPKQELLNKMSKIIGNYKKQITYADLVPLKDEFEKCKNGFYY